MPSDRPDAGATAYDNAFVCYTVQNYLKALYLAYRRYEEGERSKILALFYRGTAEPSCLDGGPVFWADVEHVPHANRYVRILERDRTRPLVYLTKVVEKTFLRVVRSFKRAERALVLRAVEGAGKVHLFLEGTYFSSVLLKRRTCTLVEEGLTTYRPYGRPARFAGEHENVAEVLLQHPEKACEAVRRKAQRLELRYDRLPSEVRHALLGLFGVETFRRRPRTAILVGQAWSCSSVTLEDVLELYGRIAHALTSRGYAVVLKPHPIEDRRRYARIGCRMLEPRIPLGVFDLMDDPRPFDVAVSILGSSVADSARLARTVVSFVPGDTVVEDVTSPMLEEVRSRVDGVLAAALDGSPATPRDP